MNQDIFEAEETFELALTLLEGDPDGLAALGLDTVNITIVGDGKYISQGYFMSSKVSEKEQVTLGFSEIEMQWNSFIPTP